jgi:hypothetical protein
MVSRLKLYQMEYDQRAEYDACMLAAVKSGHSNWAVSAWPAVGTLIGEPDTEGPVLRPGRNLNYLIATGFGKTRHKAAESAWYKMRNYFRIEPLDAAALKWQANDGLELYYPIPMRIAYVKSGKTGISSPFSGIEQLDMYYTKALDDVTMPAVVASYRDGSTDRLWETGQALKRILADIPNNPSEFRLQHNYFASAEGDWHVIDGPPAAAVDRDIIRSIAAYSSFTADYGDILFYGPVDPGLQVAIRRAARCFEPAVVATW